MEEKFNKNAAWLGQKGLSSENGFGRYYWWNYDLGTKLGYIQDALYEGMKISGDDWPFVRIINSEGDVYTGSLKSGFMHGRGKLVKASGTVQDGVWNQGVF
jgi:hypothetical protein